MNKIKRILIFLLVILPFWQNARAVDCDKSLKKMEAYVLDVITLYGKKTDLSDFIIGSYNLGSGELCDHRILVKYERKLPGGSLAKSETVFRYFNVNSLGVPLKPPVSLLARTPLLIDNSFGENSNVKWMPRPYDCDQKEEIEEILVRYTEGEYNSPSTLVASLAIPKWEYPYCEYHIFLMKFSNLDIWIKHFNLNEGWRDNDHPPIQFQGRRIPKSEIPVPH